MTAPRAFDPAWHCGAHPDDPRGPCKARKGAGTNHVGEGPCRHHGGKAPQVEAKYERAREQAAIEAAARTLGVPVTVDPAQGILDELARTLGELLWLQEVVRQEVGDRAADTLFRGTRSIRRKEGPDGVETTTEVGPGTAESLKAYERWKVHYREVCKVALAHGVAARQVELAEQHAEMLGALVAAALDAAGVDGPARVTAIDAARERFRLVTAG